jgi:tetratricopeptide (TPR) repeat protein
MLVENLKNWYRTTRIVLLRLSISTNKLFASKNCQLYHEDTARTFYLTGWFSYNSQNVPVALTYMCKSLRISHRLDGDDHPSSTLLDLDDIRYLLEDMNLGIDCANRIFHSWELRDKANELQISDPNHCAMGLYQEAPYILPMELELERATVFCKLASILKRKRQTEQALSYFSRALMILPDWLSSTHPRILSITLLTPIGPAKFEHNTSSWKRSYFLQGSIQASE